MKRYLLVLMSCSLATELLQAVPRFKDSMPEVLDQIVIMFSDPVTRHGTISIYMQENNCAETYERLDYEYIGGGNIWTVTNRTPFSYDPIKLSIDTRPYKDYYTDISLGLSVTNIGKQRLMLFIGEDGINRAVAIELKSRTDENFAHDFLQSRLYEFEANTKGTIDTYYLRIWGANRVKAGLADDADWSDAANWEGNKPPKEERSYVYVPREAKITVSSQSGNNTGILLDIDTVNNEGLIIVKDELTVGTILNYGMIQNEGTINSKIIHLF
jgi:hypothetical protein